MPEIRAWKGKNSPVQIEKFGIQQSNSDLPADGKRVLVQLSRSDLTFEWDPEQRNLLEFAESNGKSMEDGCMFG